MASSGEDLGDKLTFGKSGLFYKSPVTQAEGQKLGSYLVSAKFFGERTVNCQLTRSEDTYAFRFPTKKGLENDPEKVAGLKALARLLSQEVFNGTKVDIHMCDDDWKTIRVVIP